MADGYSGLGYGYTGNMHIKCWHCGSERTFRANKELDTYYCNDCGKKTAVEDMTLCFANCECGRRARYYTNLKKPFDLECLYCKQPVAMFPVKKRGKRTIYMSAYSLELQEEKRKR